MQLNASAIRPTLSAEPKKLENRKQEAPILHRSIQLDWNTSRHQLRLMLLALLVASAWLSAGVSAEHALSEVWSESDGLQMKYSTDHDDLLSTKGSELSLQTHGQPKQEAGNEAGGGQQEEASSSSDESSGSGEPAGAKSSEESSSSSSNSNSDESAESSSNEPPSAASVSEQGADASRQSVAKQFPTSADTPLKQQRFSEPAERYRSASDRESVRSRNSAAAKSAAESDDRFNSFSANDDGETANVDHGEDSEGSAEQRESARAKFRQPGRLFKEAVRMTDKASESEGGESEGRNDEAAAAASPAEDTPSGSGEPEFPMSGSDKQVPFKARQNMIDFDRLAQAKQRNEADAEDEGAQEPAANKRANSLGSGSFAAVPRAEFPEGADENESEKEEQYNQQSAFHDHSNQRALAAGSTAHKERLAPSQKTSIAEVKSSALNRLPAYFRAVGPQAQQHFRPNEQGARFGTSAVRAAASSDDERDNFISPGHYPGSMPHLTQAASETQKKELEVTKANQSAKDMAARASTTSGSVSATPKTEQQVGAISDTSAPDQLPSASVGAIEKLPELAESRVEPTREQKKLPVGGVEVTPVPESQPESQQIMAPILLSTTTMAPMTATSAQPQATSEAPSLKRFKFRKYR